MKTHSDEFLNSQKRRLLKLRAELAVKLNITIPDKSEGRDPGDLGQQDTEADLSFNLTNLSRETMQEIEAALARIGKGTYGLCEMTGELISRERLEVLPFARCTVNAQRVRELHRHKTRAYGLRFDDDEPLEGPPLP